MTLGRTALGRVACRALLACALFPLPTLAVASDSPITIFVAASLGDAVREVVTGNGTNSALPVRFSVAASSLLARQIEAGAPADIFVSANARWMDHLQARGLIEPATRSSPSGNRLVLVLAEGEAPWHGPLDSLAQRLGRDRRLAIADPAHVPAGLYARQALQSLGLWAVLSHRLAVADNVRGALALVARGEAPLGIVYATDARLSERVRVAGEFPASTHAPIRYHFAVLEGRLTPRVVTLFERLIGSEAVAIYAAHGFEAEQPAGAAHAQ